MKFWKIFRTYSRNKKIFLLVESVTLNVSTKIFETQPTNVSLFSNFFYFEYMYSNQVWFWTNKKGNCPDIFIFIIVTKIDQKDESLGLY